MLSGRAALRVCTAAESAALDQAAIAAGTPGRALMQRAGAAAASEIARRFPAELARGALVLAGPGNNGGDGWVVARALAAAGVRVTVWEAEPARTPDAAAERTAALEGGIPRSDEPVFAGQGVVVDALLGTGASGTVRGALVDGVRCAHAARRSGAVVVALDMPTGVDATTGETAGDAQDDVSAVHADLTVTFGTFKRGHLLARERCGRVVLLDIGLGSESNRLGSESAGFGYATSGLTLLDATAALALLPRIEPNAHKGSKGRIAIVGGGDGMAGAVILAAQGALRAGAGLVKAVVHRDSRAAVSCAVPQALTATWGEDDDAALVSGLADWADAIAIGPGLGKSDRTRALVEALLAHGDAPVVLDADALNVFAGEADVMRTALGGRPALLTPHPLEMMRLAGAPDVATVLRERFDIGARFARESGACVLLKGVPTVISAPSGERCVTVTGTPALATGGSGDVLTGMASALLAPMRDPLQAGAVAAWAHGRAAEIATGRAGTARGVPLESVMAEMAHTVWGDAPAPVVYPVLGELP